MPRPPHYVDPAAEQSDDRKPPARPETPVRAWLRPAEDDGSWTMFLEDGDRNATLAGTFDALLRTGREHVVVEYFVWSPRQRTFERFDADAVGTDDPAGQ